ncbi:MAG: hypothetical protein ACREX3_12230, partial [Gammaproteobacteria bacterium]
MAGQPPKITPIQVLYRAFPGAVRFVAQQMTRVGNIVSTRGDREDRLGELVRRALTRRIRAELNRRHVHDTQRQARRAARAQPRAGGPAPAEGGAATPPELVMPGGFDDQPPAAAEEPEAEGGSERTAVAERDIGLIEVDDNATVRTRVFPRSAHCRRCDHFLLLNPNQVPASLQCPCCRRAELRVEPIVFICGRCADIRELVPPLERQGNYRRSGRVEQALGAPTTCPDCHRGHIHLDKHGTNEVARWEWRCTTCNSYRVTLQELCMRCVLPRTDALPASVIFMQALPATASNALQPLVMHLMAVADAEVDIPALTRVAEGERRRGWADAFDLAVRDRVQGGLTESDFDLLGEASVERAFLVRDVWAVTAIYGYKAGSPATHPQSPVQTQDRLAVLFNDPEGFTRFRAFSHSIKSSALVLQFNPREIVDRLARFEPTLRGQELGQVVAREAPEIAHTEVRDLLDADGNRLIAYRALHALEHAILLSAMRQLGTDSIGTRLFPNAGAVVVYE